MSAPDPQPANPASWSLPDFSPGALLFAGVRFFGIIVVCLLLWQSGRVGQRVEGLVHSVSTSIISGIEKPQEVEQKFLNSQTGETYTRNVTGMRNIKIMLNRNFYFGICLAIAAAFLLRVGGAPDAVTRVFVVCLALLPLFVLATVLHAYYVYDLRAASANGMTYTRGSHETFLFTTLTYLAMPLLGGGLATFAGRWITPRFARMRARKRSKRKSK
jgi:hypothetical protein